MEYLTVFLLAVGLSFDSFAVSVCSGLSLPKIQFFQAAKVASVLALVQGTMPLLGWLVGKSMAKIIEPFDHWVVFGLLLLIGGKMIVESFSGESKKAIQNPLALKVILFLGLATSIDALAVGFSFATILEKVLVAILMIASVTFIASMLGILLGKKTGPHVNQYAEIIGGIILISIGSKILIEHLCICK